MLSNCKLYSSINLTLLGYSNPTVGMGVLSDPWADLALLLQHTITETDADIGSLILLWICGSVLFLSVCLLLLQLITYFNWKLRQGKNIITFLCQLMSRTPVILNGSL